MKNLSLILFSLLILTGASVKGQQQDKKLQILYWNIAATPKDTVAVTLNELLKYPAVTCSPTDFKVQSFRLTALRGNDVAVLNITGGELSPSNLNTIKGFTPGTKFWVEKLELAIETSSGKTIIPMPTMRFVVKK